MRGQTWVKRAALLLLVILCVSVTGAALAKTVTVTGGSLRMRAEPNTSAAVVAVYNSGTSMTVLATSGSWTRVQAPDGNTGWMLSTYLTDLTGNGGSTASGTVWITSANGLGVNVRSGAGYNYGVVAQLAVGTKVTASAAENGWVRITAGSTTGYVHSDYLTAKQPTSGGSSNNNTNAVVGTAWVTSGNGQPVRLRATASTGGAVLTSVPVGTQVTVLSAANGWSRVTVGSRNGFMMSQYLTAKAPSGGSSTTFTQYTAYVTSLNRQGVRLRSSAGTGNNIITEVPYAAKITVIGESGAYWQIRYGSLTGYMQKTYVTTIQPVTPADSTPSTGGLQAGGTAWVLSANGKPVNLRSGAGTGYGVIASCPVGTKVTLQQVGTYWCKVTVNGVSGWMMTQYLTTTKPNVDNSTQVSWTGYVTASGLSVNLRASASTSSEKLGEYAVGTSLTVHETQGQWSLVTIGGKSGWMMSKFISATKPASNGTYTAWVRSNAADYVPVYTTNNSYSSVVMTLPVGMAVVVTGSASGGFTRITYNGKTGYIGSGNLSTTPVSAVKISAEISKTNPRVGNKLSVKVTPSGIDVTYTWLNQNGKVLGTGSTYVVKSSDVGLTIRVRVTGTGSVSGTYTTDATQPVTN